ncbi:MAG: hypothetical protein ABMA64_23140 [Myxococcota bacterium]
MPPLEPDPRRPEACSAPLPTVEDLARIAADHEPDVGMVAAELVLGPLVDDADLFTLRTAIAWGASIAARDAASESPATRLRNSPLGRAARDPTVPLARREALRVVLHAPPGVWTVREVDGPTVMLRDELGLGAWAPTERVAWRRPAAPFGPPAPGCVVLGAVARGPAGWEMVAPIVIPHARGLGRALPWVVLGAVTVYPEVRTLPDVLRVRGFSLARRLLARCWAENR